MRNINFTFYIVALTVGSFLGVFTHAHVVENDLERLKDNIKTLEAGYTKTNIDLRLELKAAQDNLKLEERFSSIVSDHKADLIKENDHLKECLGKAQIDVVTCHRKNADLGILYDKALEEIVVRDDWAHGLEELVFKLEDELEWAKEQVRQAEEIILTYEGTVKKAMADLMAHLADQPCMRIEAVLNDLTYTLYTETQ